MKIDFSQIATHALTMLVAAVFIGAAGYLWKGIEGIDDRINRATADLRAVQEVISPKLDKVESRLTDLMLLVDPVLFPADLPGKKTQELINDNAQQQVQQQGVRP
tara:strand:+ start:920 stop:1234 length:315 start_codon:yes stop_codon:yes gene_type:complete